MGNYFCDLAFASLGSRSKKAFTESFCPKSRNFFTSRVDPIGKRKMKMAELLPLITSKIFSFIFVQHEFYFTFIPVSFSGL